MLLPPAFGDIKCLSSLLGHRSTKEDSLVLKRGMLHYCYDNKKMIQVISSPGKSTDVISLHTREFLDICFISQLH